MKNRTVMVRMLSSDQITSVTEHAKNLGALVVHQFWIDGYRDFNLMRASAVVKRQSTRIASWLR